MYINTLRKERIVPQSRLNTMKHVIGELVHESRVRESKTVTLPPMMDRRRYEWNHHKRSRRSIELVSTTEQDHVQQSWNLNDVHLESSANKFLENQHGQSNSNFVRA